VTGRQGRRCRQIVSDLQEKTGYWKSERGSTRSHSVETSLWKGLGTGRKTNSTFNKLGHICISRAGVAQSPQKLRTGYVTNSIPGTGNNFLFAIKVKLELGSIQQISRPKLLG
jgi:hypothetical protein